MPSELQTAFPASQLQRERTRTVIPPAGGNLVFWVSVVFKFRETSQPSFPRKTENQKNLKSVIPAQAGIQSVRFPFFFLNFR
ncbi:TPA: hypothetical protein ACFCLA_001276 [Neisseria gonorrhoeae]